MECQWDGIPISRFLSVMATEVALTQQNQYALSTRTRRIEVQLGRLT